MCRPPDSQNHLGMGVKWGDQVLSVGTDYLAKFAVFGVNARVGCLNGRNCSPKTLSQPEECVARSDRIVETWATCRLTHTNPPPSFFSQIRRNSVLQRQFIQG